MVKNDRNGGYEGVEEVLWLDFHVVEGCKSQPGVYSTKMFYISAPKHHHAGHS